MWSNMLLMFIVSAIISLFVAVVIESIFRFISWLDGKKGTLKD